MLTPMGRTVTLVLIAPDGRLLGAAGPFDVDTPWWQEVGEVVAAARRFYGIDVTVLRILRTSRPRPHGGSVTYLAETHDIPPDRAAPIDPDALDDDPRRQSWARPGGPASDLAWADEQLERLGERRVGAPQQVRAWNLSSLWRIGTARGGAWLKVVPLFFAHEGAVITRLRIGPTVLAHEGTRLLLRDIPGTDLYEPSATQLPTMIHLLIDEQVRWLDRTDELIGLGAPDWRAAPFVELAADVVERTAAELSPLVAARAVALVERLDRRFAEIVACGLDDSLVHGDFHGGNARASADKIVILDWGDCGVGHPLLDQTALIERLPPTLARLARDTFESAWQQAVPGSQPGRAADLLAPVAALRQAVIYRHFLDNIEPDEQPFHRDDPATWIRRAARRHASPNA